MALSNFEFTYRGFTFGNGHATRPFNISGLDDLAVTTADVRLPRLHGNIPGLHTVDARDIQFDLYITGAKGSAALEDELDAALAVFTPAGGTANSLSASLNPPKKPVTLAQNLPSCP